MKRAALLLLVPLLGLPAASAAGVDDAETCAGLPATIIGAPGQARIEGTPGDDVIVAGPSTAVYAGAGSDTICSEGAPLGAPTTVDTGDHQGPPAHDTVIAGNYVQVTSGVFGSAVENDDDVRVGFGSVVRASGIPTGRLIGSPVDSMLVFGSAGGLAWDVDLATGTVTVDDSPAGTVSRFTTVLMGSRGWSELTFRGGTRAEVLDLAGVRIHGPAHVFMGRGADTVRARPRSDVQMHGGAGPDTLLLTSHGLLEKERATTRLRLTVRLDRNRLEIGRGARAAQPMRFAGFENHEIEGPRVVVVTGSAGRDRVLAVTCRMSATGGAGDDEITHNPRRNCNGSHRSDVLGGTGDDVLRGATGDDVLMGGPGLDEADGGAGRDRCAAERLARCET